MSLSSLALPGEFLGFLGVVTLLLLLVDEHLRGVQLLLLLEQGLNLGLQVLFLDRYVSNVDDLDSLQGLLRKQVLVFALLHLECSDLLQLILDEVLTDLNTATHILEQVDEGNTLLVHASVDAYEVGLCSLQALDQGLLHGVEARVDLSLA